MTANRHLLAHRLNSNSERLSVDEIYPVTGLHRIQELLCLCILHYNGSGSIGRSSEGDRMCRAIDSIDRHGRTDLIPTALVGREPGGTCRVGLACSVAVPPPPALTFRG